MKKIMPWVYLVLMFLWMGRFIYNLFTGADTIELVYSMLWVITAILFIDTNSREEDHEEVMEAIRLERDYNSERHTLMSMKISQKFGELEDKIK